ncbi:hypothetical protein FXO38_19391 [Capsicum annuum]|nr:hypothetical protein FXO38_19391 [Capsicum annuum]
MSPIPQILLEPRHRKYDKVEPLMMIVGSQGTLIGEDKSVGVEEETVNIEIGMTTDNISLLTEEKSAQVILSLITELDVLTGLQFTYDGKLEVMDVLNFMENSGLVAPTLEKVEIDFYMWKKVFLMVSSSGKNLFPGENLHLKRAHEGHQDKVNIMCSQIAAYKNEIPVINIVVWHDGKMWRTSGHTQSFKILAAIASWKSFMAAYLVALDSKGSHAITSRHYEQLTNYYVASRQGSTLLLGLRTK